jgi:DNA-binding response OmpR family regulator
VNGDAHLDHYIPGGGYADSRRMTPEDQIRELTAEVERLTFLNAEMTALPDGHDLPEADVFTHSQRRLLGYMLRREGMTCTRAGLQAVVAGGTNAQVRYEADSVDAHICRMRQIVRELEIPIEIETVWGVGYRVRRTA